MMSAAVAGLRPIRPTRSYTNPRDVTVALGLLDGHARSCVLPVEGQLQADRTDELLAAVGRLVKRG